MTPLLDGLDSWPGTLADQEPFGDSMGYSVLGVTTDNLGWTMDDGDVASGPWYPHHTLVLSEELPVYIGLGSQFDNPPYEASTARFRDLGKILTYLRPDPAELESVGLLKNPEAAVNVLARVAGRGLSVLTARKISFGLKNSIAT